MQKTYLIILFLFVSLTTTFAQNITWDDFVDTYLQDTEESSDEGVTLYDELLEMHRNPININNAKRTDLLRLPFLNEAQADSIQSFIKRSHGIYSLGELQFVKTLYHKQLLFMPLFFYCQRTVNTNSGQHKDGAYNEPVKGLHSELSATLDMPLYKREGFKKHSKEVLDKNPNKQYLGDNLSTTLRYRSSLDNHLFWGLTAQKDEGEPFGTKDNPLYDSYSFYLMGKENGTLQQWVVGDYRAHFGLGLTIGSSTPDAMNILSSYTPRQQGFSRHTSTDEAFFLRGAAITLHHKALTLHTFASWRELDATLTKDSISTIITNGYHRTPLEMSKRNNIQALQGGLSAIFSLSPFTIGLQATHTYYDTPFRTPTSLYRKYYFQGQNFGNYSLSYSFTHHSLKLWGETATSLQGGIATQHRIQYAPSYKIKLIALHRYYTTHYLSTSAQSYKVGSRIQNEHGLLLGISLQPDSYWSMRLYADYAHYPFAIYTTRHTSDAITIVTQMEYAPSENLTFLLRYKYRKRPQDDKQHTLDYKKQHTFKLQARYTMWLLTMTTAVDLSLLSQPDKSNSSGWMMSQKAIANITKSTRINIAGAIFHTDSYSEALRLYEPSLLYYSYMPMCYYHGQRASVSAVQKIGIVRLALKYALTHYTNQTTIGSGLRAYNGSTLQNIAIQGIVKF